MARKTRTSKQQQQALKQEAFLRQVAKQEGRTKQEQRGLMALADLKKAYPSSHGLRQQDLKSIHLQVIGADNARVYKEKKKSRSKASGDLASEASSEDSEHTSSPAPSKSSDANTESKSEDFSDAEHLQPGSPSEQVDTSSEAHICATQSKAAKGGPSPSSALEETALAPSVQPGLMKSRLEPAPEAPQPGIDSHSTQPKVQNLAQHHFDADDHAHLNADPEETQHMPDADDSGIMLIDSEDVPAAHMHPVLSDAPKSGELLDSCPIAGSNADAAEGHYSPAMSTSLAQKDLADLGKAGAIEEEQASCDVSLTGLNNSQQKLGEPAADPLKVMPPEQITVSAFALAAYPTEHEVALAAPVFISDECPTQQASMTEEEESTQDLAIVSCAAESMAKADSEGAADLAPSIVKVDMDHQEADSILLPSNTSQIPTSTIQPPEDPLRSCKDGADAATVEDGTLLAEICRAAAATAAQAEDGDEPSLLVSCILGACSCVQAWTPGMISGPVSVATRAAITATAAASAICTASLRLISATAR